MTRLLLFLLLLSLSAVAAPIQIRVATYNASLNRNSTGQLAADVNVKTNAQAKKVAEIIQRVRPDVVLVNEFDYDAANPTLALDRFHDNYLAVSQNGLAVLNYPYRYVAPSNTGVPSGFDLNNNGSVGTTVGTDAYGDDAFGFGQFPGKFSFAVYSRFPIKTANIRTFQFFKWKDMPGAVLPDISSTPAPKDWYSTEELAVFRLSSKNHVDLPIELQPGVVFHLLASHPTPPSFDGAEDRNGRRNRDEIRLWADYLTGASYLIDDAGTVGGLGSEERFVILGDMNADPLDGDSYLKAINLLREHPRVNATPNPESPGGKQQATTQGGVNNSHRGNPSYDTSDFNDSGAGNLRVDHVFPSKGGFSVTGSGVFWPLSSDPTFNLVSASDHRLVYLDLVVTPVVSKAVRQLASKVEGQNVTLTWGTQAGVSYTLQTSPDLTTWTDAPEIPIVLDANTQTATATEAGAASEEARFYRVVCTIEAAPAPAPPAARRVRKRR